MNTLIIGKVNTGKTSLAEGLQLLIKYNDNKIKALTCELPVGIMKGVKAKDVAREFMDLDYYDEAVYVLNEILTEDDLDILCHILNITRVVNVSRFRQGED